MNQKAKKSMGFPVRFLISIIVILLLYYFELPPIHLRSKAFWSFLSQCVIILLIANGFGAVKLILKGLAENDASLDSLKRVKQFNLKKLGRPFVVGLALVLFIIVLQFVGDVIGHPFFHAGAYSSLVDVEDGDFASDVSELSMSQIPVVDKTSAQFLGNRKLGEISDLVSQFEIMEMYTQINYKGTPYRVTPLRYGDTFKWLTNHSSGLPAYVMVNMVTQETTLKRLDEGMKYSTSEYFFRNINRYLRICYPTKIFDYEDVSFEIDDDGTPYWVAPTISYRIGIWSGKDVSGAVLVNAITGDHQYYDKDEIPSWVDQVYISRLIMNQLDYYGRYQNGYINSFIGQKGVKQTTDGYNYIAIGDDVYLYTGMTSVTSDESNTGFILVNLRTKDTRYYAVPGATEYSAMGSAEGQVQQMSYIATFPLLLNISDRPTYFLSLKDVAGLVKMYAFVDVEQYQIVGTGTTVKKAMENYAIALGLESEETPAAEDNSQAEEEETLTAEATVEGKIEAISSAVVNGNTVYYLMLEGDDSVYTAAITKNGRLPFLEAGNQVSIEYATKGSLRVACSIEIQ